MTRLDALRGQIEAEGLDAVLISDPINRRYQSGFTGSAGWLLVTAERTLLILDYRYYERAAREAPTWEQVRVATTHEDALFEAARDLGIGHSASKAITSPSASMDVCRRVCPG